MIQYEWRISDCKRHASLELFILSLEIVEGLKKRKKEKEGNNIWKEWITVDERMQEDIKVCWESVRILLHLGNIRAGRQIKKQDLETEWLFYCKKIIHQKWIMELFVWGAKKCLMDAQLVLHVVLQEFTLSETYYLLFDSIII